MEPCSRNHNFLSNALPHISNILKIGSITSKDISATEVMSGSVVSLVAGSGILLAADSAVSLMVVL